ncbi:DUF5518 domain-containing protein [Natrinema altunense]|uniref:DUF5518 domain-containing protein n=1 Tax=Natrinema altunense TaxID=222984 RepID=UPI00373AF5C6
MGSNSNDHSLEKTYMGVDVLLGVISIPFTVILTSDPSMIYLTPVLVAGFLSGLYSGTHSGSVKRAGLRTGAIGGLPVVWSSADLVVAELSAPLDILALANVVGVLWSLFVITFSALLSALCAIAGCWVSHTQSQALCSEGTEALRTGDLVPIHRITLL